MLVAIFVFRGNEILISAISDSLFLQRPPVRPSFLVLKTKFILKFQSVFYRNMVKSFRFLQEFRDFVTFL